MSVSFDSIWIDMDGTLIDFARGNLRDALIRIEDPYYYSELRPFSYNNLFYLQDLKELGVTLHIISGIPDFVHCYHVPIFRYDEYYKKVCDCKDRTINKYYPLIFDSVDYIMQSDSKADFILDKYHPKDPVFLDDMEVYLDEWRQKVNDKCFKVDEVNTLEYYLKLFVKFRKGGDLNEHTIPNFR